MIRLAVCLRNHLETRSALFAEAPRILPPQPLKLRIPCNEGNLVFEFPFNQWVVLPTCRSYRASSLEFRQRLPSATLDLGIIFLYVRHRQPLVNQTARVGGFPHLGVGLSQFDIMH